jgi:hypothetical protein
MWGLTKIQYKNTINRLLFVGIFDTIARLFQLVITMDDKDAKSGGVRSSRGKPLGRPVVRLEPLRSIPTHCPAQMYTYFKAIYPYYWKSLTEMYEDMLTRFINEAPYNSGLVFRKPKSALARLNNEAMAQTGWTQVNVRIPKELAERIEHVAAGHNQSNAAVVYTAMFWWAQYVYSPEVIMPK